ncbi:MAG: type IV toxin-antitoxin system AbiEi family antitoxin domain-containing protein, partial [Gemmatimonadota bacterium]
MAILASGLGETERGALSALAALEQPTVTADDLIRVRGVERGAANLLLSRLARKGWLHRLRRGVYAIVPLSS